MYDRYRFMAYYLCRVSQGEFTKLVLDLEPTELTQKLKI